MATFKDLPYELLYHIIFLLVQSSGGAEEFARIISVCRDFLLYAEDVSILRVVNFNIKMEPVKFFDFQCVKGLLVKCSEAGNVAARHLLGKVILLSATHLYHSERPKVKFDVSPCDTNVPAQNSEVNTFMTYFSPIQVYTSEFSSTRLLHYQLVKLFLLNGSHHDFIEMGVFLKYCIKYLTAVTRESYILITSIKFLVQRALRVRSMEKLAKTQESFIDSFRRFNEFMEMKTKHVVGNDFEDLSSAQSGNSSDRLAVDWREAMRDVNFVETLRDVRDQLNEAYTNFRIGRVVTLGHFEQAFG